MGKRATIQDIAEKAGYSKTAVSFAFNAPGRISAEARERILSVARELDYVPDPMARNFSKGKHMAIGFLLPQDAGKTLGNPYTQTMIMGIASVCQDHGYVLSIIPPLRSSVPEAVRNAPVDGLIAMGLCLGRGIRDALRRRGLPIISIDGSEDDGFPSVGIDDESAAYMQMEAVVSNGHRDIAVISLPEAAYGSSGTGIVQKRKKGYIRALAEAGIGWDGVMKVQSPASYQGGMEAAESIIASHVPSCIAAMADISALGAIAALSRNGLSVPGDVSVIGFDGIEAPGQQLATVVQSAEEKGRESASLLFSIIEGREAAPPARNIGFAFRQGETLRRV